MEKSSNNIKEFQNEEEFSYFLSKNQEFQEMLKNSHCAMEEVATKLKVLDYDFSSKTEDNPIEFIETRLKTIPSIIKKLKMKNLPLSIESIKNNIYDIAGIRVICSFESDVYDIADAIKNQSDIEIIRESNYIKQPKKNGYRSYHLIVKIPIFLINSNIDVPVEIQFRTIAMDFWATLEHKLRYKKEYATNIEIQKRLLICAKISEHLDKEMQDVKDMIKNIND